MLIYGDLFLQPQNKKPGAFIAHHNSSSAGGHGLGKLELAEVGQFSAGITVQRTMDF